MYGAEHGFFLHTAMVAGSWLLFVVLCVLPFALVLGAYFYGVRTGRRLERDAREANAQR